ncbi:MAG: heat-inducible transcription repressor HrcA [Firmicutes bacterium]|nr:heat-inducible transcription repressor HrcA [Bacillota bacterium]
MNERKKLILQAVVDDYISTADPVGSRSIARKYNLGISPATIRNEMADLEEEGYLCQVHTSSGRIPSDTGYRFYVDVIMEAKPLSPDERRKVLQELAHRQGQIEATVQHTARILASLTNQAVVVISPRFGESVIRRIDLIPMSEDSLLVIMITEPGFVNTRIVQLSGTISPQEIVGITHYLNERLNGKAVKDLRSTLLNEIEWELRRYKYLAQEAIELLLKALDDKGTERVFREGTVNMLAQPEFQDISKVKGLLSILEEDDLMFDILTGINPSGGVEILIGHENAIEELHECSIVSASYEVGGHMAGIIGILGPTRMDYSRIVNLVGFVADSLSGALAKSRR